MTTPTLHDLEKISAYLDGQLSPAERARLDSRLAADPELRAALDDLRQTRTLLRRTPRRRVPRDFTLTPKSVGIRPPVPRLVPALGWASAVALLLFVCTLGTNFVSLGGLGPMAAAPKAVAPAFSRGVGGGPVEAVQATAAPASEVTPTPEVANLLAPQVAATPEATTPADMHALEQAVRPPSPPAEPARPIKLWPFIFLGLAILLGLAAFSVRWSSILAFRQKAGKNVRHDQ